MSAVDVPVALRPGRPLAPAQRGLWVSQRRHPTEPVQNMALVTHIDGPVDPRRLADAFASVVAASDALRTRVTERAGVPLVTLDAQPQAPELLDLPREAVRAWAEQRVAQPIDLAVRGYDSAVVRHPDGTITWYLALHHVITDATSSALVFAATAEAYHGQPPEIAPYYRWAHALDRPADPAAARRRDRALAHWRQRPEAPALTRLYRPVRAPAAAATRAPVDLHPALAGAVADRLAGDLKLLSPDLSWTALLMTVTAAHLHQVAGADQLTLGLPVHNRGDATSRRLIGPVMEVFPVDVTVEPGDTFRTLHRRVGRAIMATLAQAVPGTAPPADHSAVVNVISRGAVGPFGELATTTDWVHAGVIDRSHLLRVQLTAYEGAVDALRSEGQGQGQGEGRPADGPRLALDLNRAAAGDDHVERAPDHVRRLLAAAVTDPDLPIAVTLPDDAETALITRWESAPDLPATGRPDGSLVARLRAALQTHRGVALRHGERAWTGPELWAEAEALAGWLQSRGVGGGAGPGRRVGLELPRSADAVIAILAVLAAGGSFVPLDPRQPRARLDSLAARAGCVLTLTALPDVSRDGAVATADGPATGDPAPDDEAYLLFTSGSTGEPKGVPITHRGIDRYLRFAAAHYLDRHPAGPDGRDLVVPLFSALTFDLTMTSLFLPLLEGGELVVIEAEGPAGLAALAAECRVNWCKATPSHLDVLCRLLPPDHRLATVVVGGEAFGAGLAQRLLAPRPELAIFNEYGPTEAVVGCMIHQVDPERLADHREVPIGRPGPGVTLRIVGPGGQRLPLGAAGELLIASPGLTPGYLGSDPGPETAGTGPFVGPFIQVDGLRFYRSGDLVRLADPETAIYLGRIDEQVKVGGIRLEPTEVEEALTAHPAVARAAVRLWSPRPAPPAQRCVRCGLPSNVPGARFDEAGVCATCHDHDRVAPQAAAWFRTVDDLTAQRDEARARRSGSYDCLHLLSGGKDSTYALYQLVELGFQPYVLTLDNGFISEEAKANIRRSVADLGVEGEIATTEAMNAIFRDSLERHSNVCHGCYKTIYTLATNRAVELGIPMIVTGLSRGQLFETRLIPAQFRAERFDPEAIDRAVIEARKAYHRLDDGPNRLLDTSVFATDDIFERVTYLDFYRYVDVELADMLDFLATRAPWVRPSDTGRSTNCLINAAGIHTHLQEQGYHNYAIPYAWDVRLGHKTRQEAIDELDDQLDHDEVGRMLEQVGYTPNPRRVLTAWLEVEGPDGGEPVELPSPAELRSFLAASLPAHAIPAAFVAVEQLPLTTNGKLDTAALPPPERTHRSSSGPTVAAETELEAAVVAVWERVLGIEPISVDDDFFALGGDSLAALTMILAVAEATGIEVADEAPFVHTTPRSLAAALNVGRDGLVAGADGTGPGPTGPVPAGPWSAEQPPPLSMGEQAILFEQARHPGSVRYNVGRLYRVHGAVDGARLDQAIRAAASRHVPLSWTYGRRRRHLQPHEAVAVEGRAEPVAPADLDAALGAAHRAPFDLDAGPLLRAVIQPVDDGTTAVLLVCHHVSGDAESFDRLWAEIDDDLAGRPAPAPEVDYPSFTRWQLDHLDPEQARHWLEPGRPAAGPAFAAPDRSEPDGFLTRPATISPAELRSRAGATGFARALAAVAGTLRRYLDGDGVSLAMITSARNHPAADALFGYFLTTLPVEVDCPLDTTLDALVAACATGAARNLAARAHPYARIVNERRRAGIAEAPLQVLVAFDDLSPTRLGPLAVERRVLSNGAAVADATFFVELRSGGEGGARVDLSLEHRGSVIGADLARQMLDDLDAVLTAAVRHPATEVGRVELPGAGSVLTGPELVAPDSVLGPILGFARTRPGAEAVRADGQSLSWLQLDQRSHRLASQLVAAGIGRGDRVVVSMPRSPDLVAAILAVLRAGAAYVPVDPTYPADRISLMAARARAAAAIVGPGGPPPAALSVPVVLDGTAPDTGSTAAEPADRPGPALDRAAGDDPAYVVFTSGSTGLPRGVTVTHRQLAASTAARAGVYPETPERFLMVSSPAFDSSIVGLFWTLATGGTVVLPTDRQAHDPDALVDLLSDGPAAGGPVSHTLMVPTLYQALLDRGQARPTWPQRVIVAGEACPAALVARHHELRPQSGLTNEYGPTEASVWATAHHCAPGDDPVPIGQPIPGTWVAVVDPAGRPVPAGVAGELLIGGAGVADGYLDEPEATAARFVQGDRGRFFRTGDRVAVADGTVRFLGRLDHQLNLGGVRAEPEDIERVLLADPAVGAALVVAADARTLAELIEAADPPALAEAMAAASRSLDPAGDLARRLRQAGGGRHLQLVAHLEPAAAGAEVDLTALRARAAEALPPLLRPARYVLHPSLPRSPNGKLDRAAAADLALPAVPAAGRPDRPGPSAPVAALVADAADRPEPGGSEPGPAAGDGAPDRLLVGQVQALFATVLRVPEVGPDDSFFDLGGHSLLAMELLAEIEDRHRVEVTVSSLYDQPTPRALAGLLRRWQATGPADQYRYLVPIQPHGTRPPIFGVHVLGPNSGYYRPLAARLGPDQPLFGFGLQDLEPTGSDPTDVTEVAARYADELERCHPRGPVTLTAVSLGSVVAYELARQLRARGRTVALLALFDAVGPDAPTFDLTLAERLATHARTARTDPRGWLRSSAAGGGERVRRVHERALVQARRRLGLPLPGELRIREFVEANWQSQNAYQFGLYPDPLIVFKAGDDPFTAKLAAAGMGWAEVAQGPFDVETVPGGHLSMLAEPHVAVLAERLAAHHEAAMAAHHEAAVAAGDQAAPAGRGVAEVEASLRLALAKGRFGAALAGWLDRLDELDPSAADLVTRADRTARELAAESARRGAAGVAALRAAGVAAELDPGPVLAAAVRASIRLRLGDEPTEHSAAEAVERACAVLAETGYRLQDRLPPGGSRHSNGDSGPWARLVAAAPSCTLVAGDEHTSRLDLVWRAGLRRTVPAAGTGHPGDPAPTDLGVFLGTPVGLAAGVLALAEPGPDDVVLDIGCGDGRVLVEAVERFGCRARGIEIDHELVAAARQRVAAAGLGDRIEVIEGDGTSPDLGTAFGPATIVFLFLPPEGVASLLGDLLARLGPGARVVAHEQLDVHWPVAPDRSRLVVDRGVTVAHRWTAGR